MSQEIIKALSIELQKYGVRWLNGSDLGSIERGSNVANMAVDFSETRLEVVCKKDYFCIIFGNSKAKYDELMRNPILKPFVYVNDGIRISFSIYFKKEGGFGLYNIGKNKTNAFREVTNYTIHDANYAITSSSYNGDCGFKNTHDKDIVDRNKEIVTYFKEQFKQQDFYKDWEFTPEKFRIGLATLKKL